jgi:hypothetical protein
MNYGGTFNRRAMATLFASGMCAQVTTLTISSSQSSWGSSSIANVLALLKVPEALPRFLHLRLDLFSFGRADRAAAVRDTTISWLIDPARQGVSKVANARVEKLTLVTSLFWRSANSQPGVLDFSHLSNLKTLCLQGLMRAPSGHEPRSLSHDLELTIDMSAMKLPDSLTHIRTTAPLDHGPVADFIIARPELDIIHDTPLIPPLD